MDRKELIKAIEDGHEFEYTLFWTNGLSQWTHSPFEFEGNIFHTAEHYMMYRKAKLFKDYDAVDAILRTVSPSIAKMIGRGVRNYVDAEWKAVREQTVINGNILKFSAYKELQDLLVETKDTILVEVSPADPIWGVGMSRSHPDVKIPSRWNGENLLGFSLMAVRDYFNMEKQKEKDYGHEF